MGTKHSSKKRSKKYNASLKAGSCVHFFPKVRNERILLCILQYLLPHELIKIQYLNTFIYAFLCDELKWCKLIGNIERLHKFNENTMKVSFWYPGYKNSYVEIPIRFEIDIEIPNLFRSVETLQHRFFLIGGQVRRNQRIVSVAECYEYLEKSRKLIPSTRMTHPRTNIHTAIFRDEIYALGGQDKGQHLTCSEKYSLDRDYWISIPSLKRPIIKGAICAFENQFIYHFEPEKTRVVTIEKYSCKENAWSQLAMNIYSMQTIEYISFVLPTADAQILVFANYHYFLFEPLNQLCPYVSKGFLNDERVDGGSLYKEGNQLFIMAGFHLYWCDLFNEKLMVYGDFGNAQFDNITHHAFTLPQTTILGGERGPIHLEEG